MLLMGKWMTCLFGFYIFVAYRLVQTSNMVKEYMCFQLTTPLKYSLGKGVKPTCDDIHLNMLS